MKMGFLIALAASAAPTFAQVSPPAAITKQFRQFDALHATCMSGEISQPGVEKACDDRDRLVTRLEAAGYCFGPSNLQVDYRRWGKCEQKVRIFVRQPEAKPPRFVESDTVPARNVLHVLHVERACELDIKDGALMLAYSDMYGGQARHGCWYPTADDGYVVIYGNGQTSKQPLWRMMPRATLNRDGSATITEPGYDSETFVRKANSEHFERQTQKLRRGDY